MKPETILLAAKVWHNILAEAQATAHAEPVMENYLKSTIMNHGNLGSALSFHLSQKLASTSFPAMMLRDIMDDAFKNPAIVEQAARDTQWPVRPLWIEILPANYIAHLFYTLKAFYRFKHIV
jgi:hypothetical protein